MKVGGTNTRLVLHNDQRDKHKLRLEDMYVKSPPPKASRPFYVLAAFKFELCTSIWCYVLPPLCVGR